MENTIEVNVEEATVQDVGGVHVTSLCDSSSASFAGYSTPSNPFRTKRDIRPAEKYSSLTPFSQRTMHCILAQGQHCDLKDGQVQDDGEVLLVQGLQDFQGVVSGDTVVVDDSRGGLARSSAYQQYQPVVVQGYVTSSGEVVHVVQQDSAAPSAPLRTPQPQAYQHAYQPSPHMMHPDLYRLIKMFPDFSTKTLHRIFVMCHCDLKRALDQALFARQFRQLDSAPSYSAIAPSPATHYHHAPYRTPARPQHLQMGMDLVSDVYLPRGRASGVPGPSAASSSAASPSPILLYQQADPRLHKQATATHTASTASLDDDVVHIKLNELSADAPGAADGLGLMAGASDGGLGPGGDSLHDRDGLTSESKGLLPDLSDVVHLKDSAEAGEVAAATPQASQSAAVC